MPSAAPKRVRSVVRPVEEYPAGHIPGAFCIPVAEPADRINELPEGCKIVVYCRGECCSSAIARGLCLGTGGLYRSLRSDRKGSIGLWVESAGSSPRTDPPPRAAGRTPGAGLLRR
ncbi:rhodanese-like domain-containing protein [Streptosporangium soli]|nr:hypothetical protein [Streptosporangium sp. KLBMP 9127]